MNRRNLIKGGASLLALGALSACGTLGATPTLVASTVETDAQLLINGLQLLASTTVKTFVSASAYNSIMGYAADGEKALAALSSLATPILASLAQPPVEQINSDIQLTITALENYLGALPPSVVSVIKDVQTLLPVVLTAVGLGLVGAPHTGEDVETARYHLSQL
jgi:hypothetical protein